MKRLIHVLTRISVAVVMSPALVLLPIVLLSHLCVLDQRRRRAILDVHASSEQPDASQDRSIDVAA